MACFNASSVNDYYYGKDSHQGLSKKRGNYNCIGHTDKDFITNTNNNIFNNPFLRRNSMSNYSMSPLSQEENSSNFMYTKSMDTVSNLEEEESPLLNGSILQSPSNVTGKGDRLRDWGAGPPMVRRNIGRYKKPGNNSSIAGRQESPNNLNNNSSKMITPIVKLISPNKSNVINGSGSVVNSHVIAAHQNPSNNYSNSQVRCHSENDVNMMMDHAMNNDDKAKSPMPSIPFSTQNTRASFAEEDKREHIGNFLDEQKNGKGTYIWPDGATYTGEWMNGLRHGHGYYLYANGSSYVGEYLNGKKNGYGNFTWSDGGVYKGQWSNDVRHGKGFHTYANGSSYDGEWLNNMKHGHGKFTWSDGTSYEGGWVSNKVQ